MNASCATSKIFLWDEGTIPANQKLIEEIQNNDFFYKDTSPYDFERFSISVIPSCTVPTKKVFITVKRPDPDLGLLSTTFDETVQPYFAFGDSIAKGFTYNVMQPGVYVGDINGRDKNLLDAQWSPGAYEVKVDFYKDLKKTTANFQGSKTVNFIVGDATPSKAPSAAPSLAPSAAPSLAPSAAPSLAPSAAPSLAPSAAPSLAPSAVPSPAPTDAP